MNQIINISIPNKLLEEARLQVERGYFSSVSEVVRTALREFLLKIGVPTLPMSEKLEKRVEEAEKAFEEGNLIEIKGIDSL